jgi:hypothetical protein
MLHPLQSVKTCSRNILKKSQGCSCPPRKFLKETEIPPLLSPLILRQQCNIAKVHKIKTNTALISIVQDENSKGHHFDF